MKHTLLALLMAATGASAVSVIQAADTKLWYDKPASAWEHAAPLGNGRLGALVFGDVAKEHIMANEISLWTGWPARDAGRDGAKEALNRARDLIQAGKSSDASKVLLSEFCSLRGYGKADFGAYQAFCDVWLDFPHPPAAATDYRRDLDLATGVASVTYTVGGVRQRREYLCSHPDQVTAMRFTAEGAANVSFTLNVSSLHPQVKINAADNEVVLAGRIDNGHGNPAGMQFEARLRVFTDGGTITAEGGKLRVTGATAATVLMAGATDYALAFPDYRDAAFPGRTAATLDRLAGRGFDAIRQAHVADHQALFGRVRLDLAGPSRDELPTDRRLAAYKKSRDDRGLETLLFQYGRYLLIASSRPGGLPANLQGLWNNSLKPEWNCDYHLNINLQMNYWPADSANLSECFEPLARWSADLAKSGRETAQSFYGSRGWVAHHVANVWGFTAPGPARGIYMMEAESAAFLCQNLWDHYAFTQDRAYLEQVAWPLLKGASEFWIDNLQEVEGGQYLAVNPSFSPEHGPLSDGAYYQTMILWDLFSNCIQAGAILNRDHAFLAELRRLRDRLQPPTIGPKGELREWRDPAIHDEMMKKDAGHRHVSHLYAVYPGHQIGPDLDPAMAAAARRALELRGDAATGWSMGWKINLWARLRDGDRAHKLVGNLVADRLYANLWDSCPPFQIDGNFGYTAGVAEMLVQSFEEKEECRMQNAEKGKDHASFLNSPSSFSLSLLPALPKAWPNGKVSGLKARGNFTVDIEWKEGNVVNYRIASPESREVKVRVNGETKTIHSENATEPLPLTKVPAQGARRFLQGCESEGNCWM